MSNIPAEWKADDELTEKGVIEGTEITILTNPPGSKVNSIVEANRKAGPDIVNRELVRYLVKDPEISIQDWDTMGAKYQNKLLMQVLRQVGLEPGFWTP